MKRSLWLLTLLIAYAQSNTHKYVDDFTIVLEPTWKNLEENSSRSEQFNGKWILIGSITFKKRAKEHVYLSRLSLQWQGQKIEYLLGSLYKKQPYEDFLPIEKNLICDGTWDMMQQTLLLNFPKEQTLGLTNIYYLVLTIPDHLETTIKQGKFNIVKYCLPEAFQPCIDYTNLSLSLDIAGSTII